MVEDSKRTAVRFERVVRWNSVGSPLEPSELNEWWNIGRVKFFYEDRPLLTGDGLRPAISTAPKV